MSTAESWDLTVPDDAGELADKLRRLGVVPGQRLHIVPPVNEGGPWRVFVSAPAHDGPGDEPTGKEPTRRRLSFVGSIPDGPADLSARTDEHLAEGFGRD
jgi:hypothetical protein